MAGGLRFSWLRRGHSSRPAPVAASAGSSRGDRQLCRQASGAGRAEREPGIELGGLALHQAEDRGHAAEWQAGARLARVAEAAGQNKHLLQLLARALRDRCLHALISPSLITIDISNLVLLTAAPGSPVSPTVADASTLSEGEFYMVRRMLPAGLEENGAYPRPTDLADRLLRFLEVEGAEAKRTDPERGQKIRPAAQIVVDFGTTFAAKFAAEMAKPS